MPENSAPQPTVAKDVKLSQGQVEAKAKKDKASTSTKEDKKSLDTKTEPLVTIVTDAAAPTTSQQVPVIEKEEKSRKSSSKSVRITMKELWIGKFDFFLCVMGFNIGLGNMLRFPYLVGKNGGGAFLIPYFLMLFGIGIPLFFIEMALGQYSGKTPILFWGNISPLFKGMGWCHALGCAMYNVYYTVLMAWIFFYLLTSFYPVLGWSSCNNKWNSECCKVLTDTKWNATQCLAKYPNDSKEAMGVPASREFLERNALKMSPGFDRVRDMNWPMVGCLLLGWVSVYLCLIRGVRSMGKVVYVTALIPYLFILILLIRGCLMEGSRAGVLYYIEPEWKSLLSSQVWLEAAQQIFHSLAPSWGITITLAAHNKFHHDIYRDALVLPIVSAFTSFFGGFVTFSFAGAMAHKMNVNVRQFVKDIIKPGPALAFVIYPSAMTQLEVPQLWCICFFLLLVSLGLDSAFTSFLTFYQSIVDEYPTIFKKKEWLSKLLLSIFSLLIGLPMVTDGGFYLYQVVDYYQVNFFMLIALTEVLVVCYLYGYDRFKNNVKEMCGRSIPMVWMIWLKYGLPVGLLVMFIETMRTFMEVSYGDYKYPAGAIALGWLIAVANIIPIFIYAGYKLVLTWLVTRQNQSPYLPEVKALLYPTPLWDQERDTMMRKSSSEGSLRRNDIQNETTSENAEHNQQSKE